MVHMFLRRFRQYLAAKGEKRQIQQVLLLREACIPAPIEDLSSTSRPNTPGFCGICARNVEKRGEIGATRP